MFAKSKTFIAPVVALLVACMAVEASVPMPQWCICGTAQNNSEDTVTMCKGYGVMDGGSCKITSQTNYIEFGPGCQSINYLNYAT
ncbi:hypothetical protein BGZ98_002974, partial [Dissophora globulifera]